MLDFPTAPAQQRGPAELARTARQIDQHADWLEQRIFDRCASGGAQTTSDCLGGIALLVSQHLRLSERHDMLGPSDHAVLAREARFIATMATAAGSMAVRPETAGGVNGIVQTALPAIRSYTSLIQRRCGRALLHG